MTRKTQKQTQLINNEELPFDVAALPARGTVYRDVCRQISALTKAGKITADEHAGTIAQARSLAAVIDRASGLGGRKQETYALAGLHRQLAELLDTLTPRASSDEGAELLRMLTTPDAGDEPDEPDPWAPEPELEAAG